MQPQKDISLSFISIRREKPGIKRCKNVDIKQKNAEKVFNFVFVFIRFSAINEKKY